MTDVELDARVTALEENGGDGNSVNGETIDLFNSTLMFVFHDFLYVMHCNIAYCLYWSHKSRILPFNFYCYCHCIINEIKAQNHSNYLTAKKSIF